MSEFHEILRKRRVEAGIDEKRASYLLGLSAGEYDDLENYPDEWRTVTPLYIILFVCRLLDIDLLRFIPDMQGAAIGTIASGGELIKRRRTEIGLSATDFAEKCGFHAPFADVVETDNGLVLYPMEVTCIVCRTLRLDLGSFVKALMPAKHG